VELRDLCRSLRLRGTVILSPEGLNGFMAGEAMPFSSMNFTMATRPGMRAGPPRSANDTQPSLHGQISRWTLFG